jgi:branched-chain amino acid transport system ATP-binding protein
LNDWGILSISEKLPQIRGIPTKMLILNNIEVFYSQVILILKGLSLKVSEGAIACLLGANGAGKTTTLKAISGLLKEEEGEVRRGWIEFNGVRIDRKNAEDIAKMGIIQVMEGRRLFRYLTIEENLKAASYIIKGHNIYLRNRDLVYQYFPVLKNLCNRKSGYLSGGEQQMLAMGRALMTNPKMLLLDEPSLGLSPILVKEIYNIIKNINDNEGASVLLVEQNAKAALRISSYGYVMENGKMVMDAPSSNLIDNKDIREFYLGIREETGNKSFRNVKHYKMRKRWLG